MAILGLVGASVPAGGSVPVGDSVPASDSVPAGTSGQPGGPASRTTPAPVASTVETLTPDPTYRTDLFEGWGTSLTWFAEATGAYPDEIRNKLAELIFGRGGLNLNIARFNIGGGNAPDVNSYMRVGSAVPGWWKAPPGTTHLDKDWWDPNNSEDWNWGADPNQRWWIDKIKNRITRWEAFSNSPPYFQTVSGYVSGGFDGGKDQIRADTVDDFASYLVRVTRHLERAHGIRVASLEPLNEPNTSSWRTTLGADGRPTGGRQEGAHAGPALQESVIKAVAAELAAEHSDTTVAAMDETSPGTFLTDWNAYGDHTRSVISRLNVHTYGQSKRTAVRDVAKGAGKPLRMSEVGGTWGEGQSFTSMAPGLGIAQLIVDDLRELEPTSFVFWQPAENYTLTKPSSTSPGSNWGSIQLPFECTAADTLRTCPIYTNTKFNTIRQFTHYIRPGDRLLKTGDPNSVAALSAGHRLSVVYVNNGTGARTVRLDLSGFAPLRDASVAPITTSASAALARRSPVPVTDGTATIEVPGESVTTLVVNGAVANRVAADGVVVNGKVRHDLEQTLIRPGHEYRLRGVESGRSLEPVASGGTAGVVIGTDDVANSQQRWTLHALGSSVSARARYTVATADGGRRLAVVAGHLIVAPGAGGRSCPDPTAQWILSTTGDGTYTLVNVATGRLVDVTGQRTADGSAVGSYPPTSGPNQRWQIVDETRR